MEGLTNGLVFLGQFSPEEPIFNGILTGKPHMKNGNIYGFRLRFSQENQSIDLTEILVRNWITRKPPQAWSSWSEGG